MSDPPAPTNPLSRYTHPDLVGIWSDDTYIALMAHVEQALLDSREQTTGANGLTVKAMEIRNGEALTGHEVQALIEVFDASRHDSAAHRGLTSSDVTDTARTLQQQTSIQVTIRAITHLITTLEDQVKAHSKSPAIGRTHGKYAVPMPLSHRLNVWLDGFRCVGHTCHVAQANLTISKLRGAVGTGVHVTRQDEEDTLARLGLRPTSIHVTQIMPRHVWQVPWNAMLNVARWTEKVADDLRLMAQDGLNEWEPRAPAVSSSTMVHKHNPSDVESIIGICRMVRSAHGALTSGTDWLERDLTQSSVERIMLPILYGFTAEAVRRLDSVIHGGRFRTEDLMVNVNDAVLKGCLDEAAYLSTPHTMARHEARRQKLPTEDIPEVLGDYLSPQR